MQSKDYRFAFIIYWALILKYLVEKYLLFCILKNGINRKKWEEFKCRYKEKLLINLNLHSKLLSGYRLTCYVL